MTASIYEVNNTILLSVAGKYGYFEGYNEDVTDILPGMIVERRPFDEVRKHSTLGGPTEKMFAYENAGDGGTIYTPYSNLERIRAMALRPGDQLLAYVSELTTIPTGRYLHSNGAGVLTEWDSGTTSPGGIVAVLLEAYLVPGQTVLRRIQIV